jgi:hypothetical protein
MAGHMGLFDHARTRGPRALRANLATACLLASLGSFAIASYAGCSSSSSGSPSAADSGLPDSATIPSPDSGADAGADSATVDSSIETSADDSASPPADSTAPQEAATDTGATVDCSNDDAGDGLPLDLQCTGLYSDWASKTVATANVYYKPAYVLWSDNANKARYMYLPPGTKIDTTDMDNWVFPVGTKVWKEFALGPQRVETRLLMKTAAGWIWTSYRWTADGETGATQLNAGETNVNGTSYEIPAHSKCIQCHGGASDMLMGFDVINLGSSGAVGLSLSTLIAANQLTSNPPASVEIPEDSTGLARAPIGWLHSNCGVACHNANPNALAAGTGLYMKISGAQIIAGAGSTTTSQLITYVTAVNVVPNMQPFASEGFRRIAPGNPSLSLIPTLDSARNNPNIPQMPPIVSHIADTTDVTALEAWISALPNPSDAGGD